jgi:hypothetical protein
VTTRRGGEHCLFQHFLFEPQAMLNAVQFWPIGQALEQASEEESK